ncbi:hypothetical protein SASPL_140821 [Salvia splendens]|uniref:RRM domain-containing protein n=1 Tax=Salvia splendens TaxID=180675 RepID=A0A8X8ZCU5_SALSN|nr:hypothetical protein SASPL_140821 [Salvia splendens]
MRNHQRHFVECLSIAHLEFDTGYMTKGERTSPPESRTSPPGSKTSPPKSKTSPPESRTSPRHSSRRSRSLSRSRRSRSRSRDSEDALNPGNNLYVTGLSTRVTETELENYFKCEGKVVKCHLVRDPHSKESRGFAFVTMETTKDAERCIKNLNRSVIEGRLITVEKAKRKRERTPTPGKYEGVKNKRVLETVDQSPTYKNYAYIHAQETAGTGEDLVVTHLVGDMIEIMIIGNDMGYIPPLIAGGEVMMVITIGGTNSVPSSSCSVELEPAYPFIYIKSTNLEEDYESWELNLETLRILS